MHRASTSRGSPLADTDAGGVSFSVDPLEFWQTSVWAAKLPARANTAGTWGQGQLSARQFWTDGSGIRTTFTVGPCRCLQDV